MHAPVVLMPLGQLLFTQGFGTRRDCAGLIASGRVAVDRGQGLAICTDALAQLEVSAPGFRFEVDGQAWPWQERAYIMLHKPAGHECSQRPGAWPSVYSLLPWPLRLRPGTGKALGVQAVGRLDQDSTGLLLLSDDGRFNHRLSSPRRQVPKLYEVQTRHPLDAAQLQALREGVQLRDAPAPVRALAAEQLGERQLHLSLGEGRYHQVKRMVAAAGNRVEALHRSRVGPLALPPDLEPGQWRWLTAAQVEQLLNC